MLTDELHGRGELFAAIAAEATENVARKAFAVHAHVNRLAEVGVARDPGHMFHAVGLALVSVGGKVAVLGLHMRGGHTLHQFLVPEAVVNKVADRDNLEAELLRHFLQLRHAGHRTVLVHNLDEGSRRAESCKFREVHSRFGMSRAAQNAFFLRVEGRNMPRTAKVARLRVRVG